MHFNTRELTSPTKIQQKQRKLVPRESGTFRNRGSRFLLSCPCPFVQAVSTVGQPKGRRMSIVRTQSWRSGYHFGLTTRRETPSLLWFRLSSSTRVLGQNSYSYLASSPSLTSIDWTMVKSYSCYFRNVSPKSPFLSICLTLPKIYTHILFLLAYLKAFH